MENCDGAVLKTTARLVRAAQQHVPWYAGDFAPLRTDQMWDLLLRCNCQPLIFPFTSEAAAFTGPPAFGIYPVFVAQDCRRTERQFGYRHELAHVLNGDVGDEPTFLRDEVYASDAERIADLFALADLYPGWGIGVQRRARVPWRDILADIRGAILCNYATAWPDERVGDRAHLRLRLYREHRI